MPKADLSDPITLRVPREVLDSIQQIAKTSERSRSWVMVRAMRHYLANEGQEILAIQRGRDEIAAGQSHDIDDVIREIEAIVAGKAA